MCAPVGSGEDVSLNFRTSPRRWAPPLQRRLRSHAQVPAGLIPLLARGQDPEAAPWLGLVELPYPLIQPSDIEQVPFSVVSRYRQSGGCHLPGLAGKSRGLIAHRFRLQPPTRHSSSPTMMPMASETTTSATWVHITAPPRRTANNRSRGRCSPDRPTRRHIRGSRFCLKT